MRSRGERRRRIARFVPADAPSAHPLVQAVKPYPRFVGSLLELVTPLLASVTPLLTSVTPLLDSVTRLLVFITPVLVFVRPRLDSVIRLLAFVTPLLFFVKPLLDFAAARFEAAGPTRRCVTRPLHSARSRRCSAALLVTSAELPDGSVPRAPRPTSGSPSAW